MQDMLLKSNLADYIKNEYLKHVIEEFVYLYGESYRPVIEERLDNMELAIYNSPGEMKLYCNNLLSGKAFELTVEFLERVGITVSEELRKDSMEFKHNKDIKKALEAYFGSVYNNIIDSSEGIEYFNEKCDEALQDEERSENSKRRILDKRIEVLSFIDPDIKMDYYEYINSQQGKKTLEEVRRILAVKKELMQEYEGYKNELKPHTDYLESERNRHLQLTKEGIVDFLKELGDIIPSSFREKLDTINLALDDRLYDIGEIVRVYTLNHGNLEFPGYIEAFSKEADGKLSNPKARDYEKNDIRRQRIRYFISMGIELEDSDYERYMRDETAQKCIPSYETVEKVQNLRTKKFKEVRLKYATSYKNYNEIIKKVNESDLKYTEKDIISDMDAGVICIKLYVAKAQEGAKLKPFLFYSPMRTVDGEKDLFLIHELVHVIESEIIKDNEKSTDVKCGLENIEVSDNEKKGDSKRPRELSNEVLTQMVAITVAKRLHEKGIYLFENSSIVKSYGGTSYDLGKCLFNELFTEYRPAILSAKIGKSIEPLINKIGQDNFMRLNDLTNEFFSFPQINLSFAMVDYYQNKEREENKEILQKIRGIFTRKNQILEDIKTYEGIQKNNMSL